MTFHGVDAWWWPFLFILVAGWLATDVWRFLGVYLAGHIRQDAEILVLVRALATALVAAVISNLIIFPTGALSAVPLALRIGAAGLSFCAYLAFGRRVWVGVLTGEAVLLAGILVFQ